MSRHPAVLQALKASPIGSSIDVVDVPFSLAELTAVADRMRAERNALAHLGLPPGFAFGVSPPEGKVNIYLPGATEQQKQGIVAHFGPAVQVLDRASRLVVTERRAHCKPVTTSPGCGEP